MIGWPRGGSTTKVIAVSDAAGRPVRLSLLPGNRHEMPLLQEIIEEVETDESIAGQAYTPNRIRNILANRGISAVIPTRPNGVQELELYEPRYKRRHLVENLFAGPNDFESTSWLVASTRFCTWPLRW